MKLRVKAIVDWDSTVITGMVFKDTEIKISADSIEVHIESDKVDEIYESFLFEPYCPICDGKGHDILRIDTTGFNDDLMDFDEDSEFDVPAEPIKIDCHFCDGRKIVSWEEIRKMQETKSKYCSCHHVLENDIKHVTEQKWIHSICGKIIQE